jgi:hypothetical protein
MENKMKKILGWWPKILLMALVFFLCAAPIPQHPTPTTGMTLNSETQFVDYIFKAIQDEIDNIDWNQNRRYQAEVEQLGKVLKRYGYTKQNYLVVVKGANITVRDKETGEIKSQRNQVLGVVVQLEGFNQPMWQYIWNNESATFPEFEDVPENDNEKLDV